jgi:hypothetical protein
MKYLGKLERIPLIGNSTILQQVHYFPTSQLTRFLLNNTVPNRLCLIRGSQWKTKILQTPEYGRAMNPFGSGKQGQTEASRDKKKSLLPFEQIPKKKLCSLECQPTHPHIDITHKTQFRLIHINLQTGNNFET